MSRAPSSGLGGATPRAPGTERLCQPRGWVPPCPGNAVTPVCRPPEPRGRQRPAGASRGRERRPPQLRRSRRRPPRSQGRWDSGKCLEMVNRLPLYGSGGLARRGPSPGVLCRAVPGSWESAVGCASRPDSRAGMCNGAGHPTAGTKSHLIPPAPAARHNKPGPCLSFPHRGVSGTQQSPPFGAPGGLAVLVAGLARVGGVKVRANPTPSRRQREGSGWEVILGG